VLLATGFGQPATIDADGFSKAVQTEALCATVRISNAKQKKVGTGVLLGKSGTTAYVLTAAHVVAGAEEVEVHAYTKDDFPKPRAYKSAMVIGRRPENRDLALVRIPNFTADVKTLPIATNADGGTEKKISAISVGCPDFKRPALCSETIQVVRTVKLGQTATVKYWQSDRRPELGESGGPLVNAKGQLLGICSGCQGDHGYYCHIEDLREFLRSSGLNWVLEPKR
jgi:S1-C subfamily serine protease